MLEDFYLGDKVIFIHSKDYGVVTKLFDNNKLFVEDSSGFNTLVKKTEIIKYVKDTNTVLSFGEINFVKDRVDKKEIKIEYCPTSIMLGDFFTKPLQGQLFQKFRNVLMKYDPITVLK